MKLTFIGTGYVGLVSGVMMSYLGHHVTCVDIDQDKVNHLLNGKVPIHEPGLEDYINICKQKNRLYFKHGYDYSLSSEDAFFITVGTPSSASGAADLSAVYQAIDGVLAVAGDQSLIIIKSTVPPGSSLEIQKYISSRRPQIKLANNPEFLREGSAVVDFLIPDRIVVGSSNADSLDIFKEIYRPMLNTESINLLELDTSEKKGDTENSTLISNLTSYRKKNNLPIVPAFVTTDLTTSEMIKYASNTFLATKVAMINEMSDLCESTGANIKDLSFAIGLDKRIGAGFLKAGPGFGGSCFPKDILALQHIAKERNVEGIILDAVIKSNKSRPAKMVRKIKKIIGDLSEKHLAILGLAYKAGTDDFRSSPALEIIKLLKESGVRVRVFDPIMTKMMNSSDNTTNGIDEAARFSAELDYGAIFSSPAPTVNYSSIGSLGMNPINKSIAEIELPQGDKLGTKNDITFIPKDTKIIDTNTIIDPKDVCYDAYEACMNVDAVVFITEWEEFQDIDFLRIKEIVKNPVIIDLRHFLDVSNVKKSGLYYHTIGSQ